MLLNKEAKPNQTIEDVGMLIISDVLESLNSIKWPQLRIMHWPNEYSVC